MALVAIGVLTLRPAPEAVALVERTPWWCVVCGGAGAADVFQNILLFVPLGIGLGRLGWPVGRAAAAIVATTLAIELSQAYLIAGRDATLGDVLMNALGGLLGWWAAPSLGRILRPPPRIARWATAALVAAFLAQLAASAHLLVPDLSLPTPWRVVTAPVAEHRERFAGSVLAASLDGRDLLRGAPPTTPPRGASHTLELVLVWVRPASPRTAPILRVEQGDDALLAAVDAREGQFGIELRSVASAAKWRGLTVAIPEPPSLADGDTVRVGMRWEPGRVTGWSEGPQGRREVGAAVGALHGWVLLNPFTPRHDLGAAWRWWTVAWLAGWAALVGWGAKSVRGEG